MATVNDNYPKSSQLSDEQLKELALQNLQRQEIQSSGFPTETVSLPSQGKVYAAENPLSSGTIEMKYMTAREEDILTSANLIKQGVVLDKLFQSLIVSPIKYNDLVIGDKNAIMVAARILGYGKDYETEIRCPECNLLNPISIDLSTLPESNIPEDVIQPAPGLFEFILPQSKRTVVFKLLTIGDEINIEKELNKQKKLIKDEINRELTTRLKFLITSIDGNSDRKSIENFVDTELFAQDSRALRSYINYISPDINLETSYTCTHCNHATETLEFGLDHNFFWPNT